jgi:hypothetical protein
MSLSKIGQELYGNMSIIGNELYSNRVFMKESLTHRHRTWFVRVVHRDDDHYALIRRSKEMQASNDKIRFLIMVTNDEEMHHDKDRTQLYYVSYIGLWYTDAIRMNTLRRDVMNMCNGINRDIRLFREDIKAINKRRHNQQMDFIDAKKAEWELKHRLAAGHVIYNKLSFCLMETNDFWDLVDQQLQQNEKDPTIYDVVCGTPSKIKHKKRKNASLERTKEECKKRCLHISHSWRAKESAYMFTKDGDEERALTDKFQLLEQQRKRYESDNEDE